MQRLPNILLVVMDCARADKWLGPGRRSVTPTVDRLAAEGVGFPTTIAETSCTTPCFAGMLTGAYSFRHGVASVGGYRLADDLPTLPELLAARGYSTCMEATGPLLPLAGLSRGFHEYNYRLALEHLHTAWGRRLRERLRTGGLKPPWFLMVHLWELHLPRQVLRPFRRKQFGRTPYERAVSSLDAQLDELLDVARRAPSAGGLLTVLTGDHGEKTAEEAYLPGTAVYEAARLYGAQRTPRLARLGPHWLLGPVGVQGLRARFQARLETFSQRLTPRPIAHGGWRRLLDTWQLLKLSPQLKLREMLALRRSARRNGHAIEDSSVLDADAAGERLDRLVTELGEERLFDIYLRMWAGMLRLHLLAGHVVHVYDFLTRVPLLLHWPEHLPAGMAIPRMVRQVDIAATILDLVDKRAASPKHAEPAGATFSPDGQSLLPLMENRPWQSRPAYLSVTGQPRDLTLRGVRTEDWKLTYGSADDSVPRELYDLRADPAERRNLAGDHPPRCAELRALAESMLPVEGPRVQRLGRLTPREQRELETRLRDLGYVE